MIQKSITAWTYAFELVSPDQNIVIRYSGDEIAMGGPARGNFKIGDIDFNDSGSSLMWSEDSRYLAYPKWIEVSENFQASARMTSLYLFDLENKKTGHFSKSLAPVYQILSFVGDKIEAKTSPLQKASPVHYFLISEVNWD